MTRQQYLEMRRSGQYDFGLFYSYYLQNKPEDWITLQFEIFLQTFRMYFQIHAQGILDTLDAKFSVQKIEDSNRNILYIN